MIYFFLFFSSLFGELTFFSRFLVRAIICNTSFLSWFGWEKNFFRARKNCFISNPCCWKNKVFRGFKVQSSPKVLGFLLHLSHCSHNVHLLQLLDGCMLKLEILYTSETAARGTKSGTFARTWAHWGWRKIVEHFPYDEKQKAQKLICRIWKCVFVIFLI